MRFQSGITDQYIYFVAVDSTDLKTRETGLSSFTVYRSRNGGAAAAYTTPTINETDSTNMPGVYELLLDEDMTIDSGDDSQAVVLHITQASMAPVTLTYELYRPVVTAGGTLTVTAGLASANATQIGGTAQTGRDLGASVLLSSGTGTGQVTLTSGRVNADVTHIATAAVSTTTAQLGVNVVQISADATAADNLELAYDDTAGPVPHMGILDQGTAQSASGTGVVLRAAAAFADDTLIGSTIAVYGSTQGYWQVRQITDNALSGDTVTVDTWTVTPSGTISYKIFATPPASATAVPDVNVTKWLGTACATPTVAGVPEVDLTHVAGATTNVSALATNVDAILTDTAVIGATGGGLTSLASAANLATLTAYVDTEVAAILADTNELQTDWANGGRLDLLLDGAASAGDPWTTSLPGSYTAGQAGYIVGTNVNATVSSRASQTSVDTVDDLLDTEVAAIKAKTDQLTFTVSNQLDANIQSVNDVALVGDGSATPWGPA
jgi:hypothetical protein